MAKFEKSKSITDAANSETENSESKTTGGNAFLRLPYGLAKDRGLSTEGMTPREVWELLKGKGIDKDEEERKFINRQKSGEMHQAPQDEPEKFFGDEEKQAGMDDFLEWEQEMRGKEPKEERKEIQEQKNKSLKEEIAIIENAIKKQADWRYEFNRMMDNEYGSSKMSPKPQEDIGALKKQYPRGAAYLQAESYERASNYEKSAAGKRAKEKIIAGGDPQKVLEEMEKEWTVAAERHIWD